MDLEGDLRMLSHWKTNNLIKLNFGKTKTPGQNGVNFSVIEKVLIQKFKNPPNSTFQPTEEDIPTN